MDSDTMDLMESAPEVVVENRPGVKISESDFSPTSIEDLRATMVNNGTWNDTTTDKDGGLIVWDEFQLQSIYHDYKKGERKFLRSTYETPDGKKLEKIESEINLVKCDVFYQDQDTGKYYVLRPHLAKRIRTFKDGKVVDTQLVHIGEKREKSSIAGKMNIKIDQASPKQTIIREIKEETENTNPDLYSFTSKEEHEIQEEMSKGMPLWTRYNITSYQVWFTRQAYKEKYVEIGKKLISEDKTVEETRINILKWKEVDKPI